MIDDEVDMMLGHTCVGELRQFCRCLLIGHLLLQHAASGSCNMLHLATWHYQVRHQDLDGFAVLIERGRSYLDQPLLGTRLRWAHLDDLALDSQFVSRAYRVRPAKFIEACTDNASCGLKLALNQEPHGERRRVPAAGR